MTTVNSLSSIQIPVAAPTIAATPTLNDNPIWSGPLLSTSGVASADVLWRLATKIQTICKNQPREKLANYFADAIGKTMKELGVPVMQFHQSTDVSPKNAGTFSPNTWQLKFKNEMFERILNGTVEDVEAFIVNLVHEARHAQIFFDVARLLAGHGKTADQIADELDIPIEIANEAVSNSLDPLSNDAYAAAIAFQTHWGDNAGASREVYQRAEKASADLRQLYVDHPSNVPVANQEIADQLFERQAQLMEQRDIADQSVFSLPTEQDAYAVGELFEQELAKIGGLKLR